MIKELLVKSALVIVGAASLLFSVFNMGKQAQRTKELERNVKIVKKFKLREESRRRDSSALIRKRLSKYVRK